MINETAAIFEARGHGFTEVRMPSHNADNNGYGGAIHYMPFKCFFYFGFYIVIKGVPVFNIIPNLCQISPPDLLSIFKFCDNKRPGIKLIVLNEMLIFRHVYIENAEAKPAIFELFREIFFNRFSGILLYGHTVIAAEITVKVIDCYRPGIFFLSILIYFRG